MTFNYFKKVVVIELEIEIDALEWGKCSLPIGDCFKTLSVLNNIEFILFCKCVTRHWLSDKYFLLGCVLTQLNFGTL
jgi:hypothetical protein